MQIGITGNELDKDEEDVTFMGVQILKGLQKGLQSMHVWQWVLRGLPEVTDGGDMQVEQHQPGRGGFTRMPWRAGV